MVKTEIRKETTWLGNEKDVIYEDGEKVGETRHEQTIFGNPVDRTYDTDGNMVSQTRHEQTIFGNPVDRTYDNNGDMVSQTRYEESIFGETRGVIRQDGDKIGELRSERGIFGGRKQVLINARGDVDLTRRAIRNELEESVASYPGQSQGAVYSGNGSGSYNSSSHSRGSTIGGVSFLLGLALLGGVVLLTSKLIPARQSDSKSSSSIEKISYKDPVYIINQNPANSNFNINRIDTSNKKSIKANFRLPE